MRPFTLSAEHPEFLRSFMPGEAWEKEFEMGKSTGTILDPLFSMDSHLPVAVRGHG